MDQNVYAPVQVCLYLCLCQSFLLYASLHTPLNNYNLYSLAL